MEAVLILVGGVLVLAGLVGCVLPILPGPPLSWLGLLALWGARAWHAETFGGLTVLLLGLAAGLVTLYDLVAPVRGAQKRGAGKAGLWGSVIGMIVGAVFFPPFGMVLGAFLGAYGGEVIAGNDRALGAAWGVFTGTMMGIALKLVVSLGIAVFFVIELVALLS